MKLKSTLTAFAGAALFMLGSGNAVAANSLPDFCVNDSAYTGIASPSNCSLGGTGFQMDLFNGSYNEIAVVYQDGAVLRFKATIVVDWGQLLWENSTVEPLGLNVDYDLYGIVTAEGVITGANTFVASTASLAFYADDLNNTALGPTSLSVSGSGAAAVITWNGVNTADDDLLASSNTLLSGSGTTSEAAGQDGFAVLFDNLALQSPDGTAFFTAPRPFYLQVYSDGDINDGNTETVGPGVLEIAGDVSANMEIPEPGTVALTGLALLGIGAARRRKA